MTVPIGPVEQSRIWFAGARMSINVWSAFVWSSDNPAGTMHTYLSRVLEKGTAYTMTLLRDILEHVDLRRFHSVCLHSDVGPHFFSHTFIGTISSVFTHDFQMHFTVKYGFPKHFKNVCDGIYPPGLPYRI